MRRQVAMLLVVLSMIASGCASMESGATKSPVAHMVLVGFKEDATAQAVDEVVAAAYRMPESIPGFLAFHGGPNNSPEGLDQGHTHGFLMTFENGAALETYSPHPVHRAFAEFAKPRLDRVFVFDLEVEGPPPAQPGNVQHLVFFKYNDDVTEEDLAEVGRRFAALKDLIPGLVGYTAGENLNPGRALGFRHVYLVTFQDAAAREVYLPHPAHKAFVDFIKPKLADVLVVDFTVEG